ncbi:hypothetical protein HAX54_005572 [Datura stramonium]|uniref:Uncharacterized protein n=1 Tax=Datura stramonium TaxID=4076 RepID=A0ABS8RXM9_DATST|nr:hypothetical protein [Datura stramonium]
MSKFTIPLHHKNSYLPNKQTTTTILSNNEQYTSNTTSYCSTLVRVCNPTSPPLPATILGGDGTPRQRLSGTYAASHSTSLYDQSQSFCLSSSSRVNQYESFYSSNPSRVVQGGDHDPNMVPNGHATRLNLSRTRRNGKGLVHRNFKSQKYDPYDIFREEDKNTSLNVL